MSREARLSYGGNSCAVVVRGTSWRLAVRVGPAAEIRLSRQASSGSAYRENSSRGRMYGDSDVGKWWMNGKVGRE